jgi:hypothetical protein
MKAKLEEKFSLDVPCSLESFSPEDKSNFGISLRLMVGTENSDGAESFDVVMCSPDWIKNQRHQEDFLWGTNFMGY